MLTPTRRREGDGLRHRPRDLRRLLHDDADRGRGRHRAVPLPRAGARRDGGLTLRRLLRPAACSTSSSPAGRRSSATARSRSPTSTCASRRPRRPTTTTSSTPEIDAIVMKSLAKRVEDRYQSAAAMSADIERYLAGHPIQAPAVAAGAETQYVPPVPPGDATSTMAASPPHPARRAVAQPRPGGGSSPASWSWPCSRAARTPQRHALRRRARACRGAQRRRPDRGRGARSQIADAGFAVGRIDRETSETVAPDTVISRTPTATSSPTPAPRSTSCSRSASPRSRSRSSSARCARTARAAMLAPGPQGALPGGGLRRAATSRSSAPTRPAGTSVAEGTTITIVFSDGPEKVPDVRRAEAGPGRAGHPRRRLRAPDVRTDADTTEPKGTVVDQIPAGGTADQGSTVTIFVSRTRSRSRRPPRRRPRRRPSRPDRDTHRAAHRDARRDPADA